MSFKLHKAFTVIECLVCLGIISLLAGAGLSMASSSKRQAYEGEGLQKLHQLGLAASIYDQDEGDFPLTPKDLFPRYISNVDTCATKLDNTTRGIGNLLGNAPPHSKYRLAPFKLSFAGILEGFTSVSSYKLSVPDPGPDPVLFVDLSTQSSIPSVAPLGNLDGLNGQHYVRLLRSGTIVRKLVVLGFNRLVDPPNPCYSPQWSFYDPSAKEQDDACQEVDK